MYSLVSGKDFDAIKLLCGVLTIENVLICHVTNLWSLSLAMRFQPVSHSWVALNPKPKGVIQFIGGAFFGTFWPMLFYRNLLQRLFDDRYTIILLPFNFSFNHYAESGFLIREQYEITPELVRRAILAGYDYKPYLDDQNFAWVGHSIGCKYISLLEGFSALPSNEEDIKAFITKVVEETSKSTDSPEKVKRKIDGTVTDILILINDLKQKSVAAKKLIEYYISQDPHVKNVNDKSLDVIITSIFIKGQPSLLLAPVNTGLDSAVPKPLADIIIKFGFNVKPTPEETYALIKDGDLFNLLGLVSFPLDNIAKSTVQWFDETFKKPPNDFRQELKGGHLRPLGFRIGNLVFNFPDLRFLIKPNQMPPIIESTQRRSAEFETPVSQLYQRLEKKQESTKK